MATPTISTGRSITKAFAPELLTMICGYLSQEDLINFRLTSKACADVAAKDLVQDLHVIFTRNSFRKLLNISKQPSLSKYVRSLYYEPRILISVPREEFARMMLRQGQEASRAFAVGWLTYCAIHTHQSRIEETYHDISSLAQALSNFTNLKKIKVNSDGPLSPKAAAIHRLTKDLDEELILHDPEDSRRIIFRALQSILNAVYLAGTELTSFSATFRASLARFSALFSLYIPLFYVTADSAI